VKWTLDSIRDGSLTTLKTTTYKLWKRVDAPDDATVIIHLSEPDGTLLYNVSEGAFRHCALQHGKPFNRHPIGSGPFALYRRIRTPRWFCGGMRTTGQRAQVERVRLTVVPDATTRALEIAQGQRGYFSGRC